MNIQLRPAEPLVLFENAANISGFLVSKRSLRLRLYGLLVVIDMLSVLAGFITGNIVRFGTPLASLGISMGLMLAPIYLGAAVNGRAYAMDVLTNTRSSVVRAVIALIFAVGAVFSIIFFLRVGLDFSRLILAVSIAVTAVFMIFGRLAFGKYSRFLIGTTPLSEIVIRDGADCAIATESIHMDAMALAIRPDLADPMMLDRLGRIFNKADRVVVACTNERRLEWAMALKSMNISGELITPELDVVGAIGTGRYVGQATMRVSIGPLGLRDRVLKRLLDLVLAMIVLFLSAPLMLIVAIAIKWESPGPALFRQKRIGRGNRLFAMYKFRSMKVDRLDANASKLTAKRDDRVTRVGAFIRRTSIDELPQIINVLLGNMSVVGPRPHATGALAGDSLYWEVDARYWHRHAVKPGMTGLAQVRGYRGTTFQRLDLVNRLQADLEYVSGWTIWRDLSILAATFPVLVHRNAF